MEAVNKMRILYIYNDKKLTGTSTVIFIPVQNTTAMVYISS